MADSGGQPGNTNATKNKPWTEAIAKFMTQNPEKRDKIIAKLYAKAEEGDLASIKEIFDRTEGKTPQAIDVNASLDLASFPIEDLLELQRQLLADEQPDAG